MTKKKPTVHFAGDADFINYGSFEEPIPVARVYAIDHPILGENFLRTSKVIKKNDDGSFETLNTLYVPL